MQIDSPEAEVAASARKRAFVNAFMVEEEIQEGKLEDTQRIMIAVLVLINR
jgi:hypothetical protein